MRLVLINCFAAVTLLTLGHAAWSKPFSQHDLEYKAEVEGYGYKTSNLMLLREVLEDPELVQSVVPYKAKVPEFVGISSAEIQSLLSLVDLDLLVRWNLLISESMHGHSKESAISSRNLPQHFLDASRLLARDIESAFVRLSKMDVAHGPLDAFLQKSQTEHWRLMARSTGKEDTDKLANAGGNLSVANLSPNRTDVLVAIGRVIGSYFEDRSLMQRIGAGDTTIFEPPLTPVLIQRMIGEELGGAKNSDNIPVGCVIYTEETAGRLDEIHTFQCSFGHNEGVVQSLVPLDTYYISKSSNIRSIIKDKTKRIVPMLENGVFGLEDVNNPQSLRKQPAMDKDAILTTFKVTDAIDSYYGKHMDIELVYERQTKTIYVVQARPLVIPNAGDEGPSYLLHVTDFTRDQTINIDAINPGNSSIQRIKDADEIIVADTLADALKDYTSPHKNREKVIAVFAKREVDATSHAAAVFRGDGKTIFETKEVARLRDWLKGPVDLLVDAQRGLIVNIVNDKRSSMNMHDLFKERMLVRGWLNYPIPLRVSVEAHQPQYCLAPQMKIDHFFDKVKCLVNRLDDEVEDLNRLTENMREKAKCNSDKQDCLREKIIAEEALPKLENLNTYAHELDKEMKEAPSDVSRLMQLFPKRFLEALIYQEKKQGVASTYSFKSVKEEMRKLEEFVKSTLEPMITDKRISNALLKDAEMFRVAHLGSHAALTDKVARKWILFVDSLAQQTKEKQAQLVEMTQGLDGLDVLPLWINSVFAEPVGISKRIFDWLKSFVSAETSIDGKEFYDEFDRSKDFLKSASEMRAKLSLYDQTRWEDPKKFDDNRKKFQKEFLGYFLSDRFFHRNTDLETFAALSLMEPFVDAFDLSIKSLKGSNKYPDIQTKVRHFKILLEDYMRVLEKWAKKLPPHLLSYHHRWPLEKYLETLRTRLVNIKLETQEELFPSAGFSVAAAALGTGTEYNRHFPKTLEDIFTNIHQSLNVVSGAMIKDTLAERLVLPEDFELHSRALLNANTNFKALFGIKTIRVSLTGINVSSDGLRYSMNIPLRNHSARADLYFDKQTKTTDLLMYFLGQARLRWNRIQLYSEAWALLNGLGIKNTSIGPQELKFTVGRAEQISSSDLVRFIEYTCDAADNSGTPSQQAREFLTTDDPERFVEHQNPYVRGAALLSFRAFVTEGKSFEAAERAAEKGFGDSDLDLRADSLILFKALFKEGKGFEAAKRAAKQGLGNSDWLVQQQAKELLNAVWDTQPK